MIPFFKFVVINLRKEKKEKGESMKLGVIAAIGVILLGGQAGAQEGQALKTEKEKISYILGVDIGSNMKKHSVDIDPDILSQGLKDGLSGAKPRLSDKEIQETMTAFQQKIKAKQEEMRKAAGEINKKEEAVFLAENKKKEGVTALPSGLQYKILKPGAGKKPQASDTVTVHYRGSLINGTEFDSSFRRGQPATFPVSSVIRGWTEALQLMQEGAKWQLFIPSGLAYGEKGAGQMIGPNQTLIFEVELVSIQEKK